MNAYENTLQGAELSPRSQKWVSQLSPVLELYSYTVPDVAKLAQKYNYKSDQIDEAVRLIVDSQAGHEQGLWQEVKGKKQQKKQTFLGHTLPATHPIEKNIMGETIHSASNKPERKRTTNQREDNARHPGRSTDVNEKGGDSALNHDESDSQYMSAGRGSKHWEPAGRGSANRGRGTHSFRDIQRGGGSRSQERATSNPKYRSNPHTSSVKMAEEFHHSSKARGRGGEHIEASDRNESWANKVSRRTVEHHSVAGASVLSHTEATGEYRSDGHNADSRSSPPTTSCREETRNVAPCTDGETSTKNLTVNERRDKLTSGIGTHNTLHARNKPLNTVNSVTSLEGPSSHINEMRSHLGVARDEPDQAVVFSLAAGTVFSSIGQVAVENEDELAKQFEGITFGTPFPKDHIHKNPSSAPQRHPGLHIPKAFDPRSVSHLPKPHSGSSPVQHSMKESNRSASAETVDPCTFSSVDNHPTFSHRSSQPPQPPNACLTHNPGSKLGRSVDLPRQTARRAQQATYGNRYSTNQNAAEPFHPGQSNPHYDASSSQNYGLSSTAGHPDHPRSVEETKTSNRKVSGASGSVHVSRCHSQHRGLNETSAMSMGDRPHGGEISGRPLGSGNACYNVQETQTEQSYAQSSHSQQSGSVGASRTQPPPPPSSVSTGIQTFTHPQLTRRGVDSHQPGGSPEQNQAGYSGRRSGGSQGDGGARRMDVRNSPEFYGMPRSGNDSRNFDEPQKSLRFDTGARSADGDFDVSQATPYAPRSHFGLAQRISHDENQGHSGDNVRYSRQTGPANSHLNAQYYYLAQQQQYEDHVQHYVNGSHIAEFDTLSHQHSDRGPLNNANGASSIPPYVYGSSGNSGQGYSVENQGFSAGSVPQQSYCAARKSVSSVNSYQLPPNPGHPRHVKITPLPGTVNQSSQPYSPEAPNMAPEGYSIQQIQQPHNLKGFNNSNRINPSNDSSSGNVTSGLSRVKPNYNAGASGGPPGLTGNLQSVYGNNGNGVPLYSQQAAHRTSYGQSLDNRRNRVCVGGGANYGSTTSRHNQNLQTAPFDPKPIASSEDGATSEVIHEDYSHRREDPARNTYSGRDAGFRTGFHSSRGGTDANVSSDAKDETTDGHMRQADPSGLFIHGVGQETLTCGSTGSNNYYCSPGVEGAAGYHQPQYANSSGSNPPGLSSNGYYPPQGYAQQQSYEGYRVQQFATTSSVW